MRETLGENHPRPRVSPSPSLSTRTQGERGGDTGAGRAETGDVSPSPVVDIASPSPDPPHSACPGLPVTVS